MSKPRLLLIHCSNGIRREQSTGSAAVASDRWSFMGTRERDPRREGAHGMLFERGAPWHELKA
jgi:hypothetical protein